MANEVSSDDVGERRGLRDKVEERRREPMRIVGGLERSNELVGSDPILIPAGNVSVCIHKHHIRADAVSFHRVDVVVEVVAVGLSGFSREVGNMASTPERR